MVINTDKTKVRLLLKFCYMNFPMLPGILTNLQNEFLSSGTITLFVSFIMVKQGYVFFVYDRSKISDLFILQFVYFASCEHLFYFHQFNLFYKPGPYSVIIIKIKSISKMNYKNIQTRIINNDFKKNIGPSILSLKGQSMAPCPVCVI